MFGFKSIVLMALALASATAGPSTEELLAIIDKLEATVEQQMTRYEERDGELRKMRKQLEEAERSALGMPGDQARKLKKKKKKKDKDKEPSVKVPSVKVPSVKVPSKKSGSRDATKFRNICYAEESPDVISLWSECRAFIDDIDDVYDLFGDGYADCNGGNQRYLTHAEVENGLKEVRRKMGDCLPSQFGAPQLPYDYQDSRSRMRTLGEYELGPVLIGESESLVLELTATTINVIREFFDVSNLDFWNVEASANGYAGAGVFATAVMWEGCTKTPCIGSTKVRPEPVKWIPLHVFEREVSSYWSADDYYFEIAKNNTQNVTIWDTTTIKLFFPDSVLEDDTTYFVTLEIAAEVSTHAHACYGDVIAYMFANATLGPHIIDAEIITDADFGNCNWLDPSIVGCGLFDKLSGSQKNGKGSRRMQDIDTAGKTSKKTESEESPDDPTTSTSGEGEDSSEIDCSLV